MKFSILKKDETEVEFKLLHEDDEISVMASLKGEDNWFYLITFTEEGNFYRSAAIPERLGFALDDDSRIKENTEE